MNKKEKPNHVQQEESGATPSVTNINQLRTAQRLMDDAASRIPPLSPEQIHALISSGRLPQFQLRRQADHYLLTLCLSLLALEASILWHTLPAGATLLNIAFLILAVADGWVAILTAYSLWLMRQTLRRRTTPLRMASYADRLNRLSHHRRWWLNLVLRNSPNASFLNDSCRERIALRIPSYATAACILLILAFHTNLAFASIHNYAKVTTTSNQTDEELCRSVKKIIEQL